MKNEFTAFETQGWVGRIDFSGGTGIYGQNTGVGKFVAAAGERRDRRSAWCPVASSVSHPRNTRVPPTDDTYSTRGRAAYLLRKPTHAESRLTASFGESALGDRHAARQGMSGVRRERCVLAL